MFHFLAFEKGTKQQSNEGTQKKTPGHDHNRFSHTQGRPNAFVCTSNRFLNVLFILGRDNLVENFKTENAKNN